jgi:hypothetical protein
VRSKRRNSCSAFFRSPRTVDVAIRQQADALRIAIEEIRRSPLTEYFPKELTGQANGALNILHIGGACIIQYAIGFVIALWPSHGGIIRRIAYQAAFAVNLAFQIAALERRQCGGWHCYQLRRGWTQLDWMGLWLLTRVFPH